MKAARSTCFIGVKPGMDPEGKKMQYATGTAFFIGPKILLTTAHLVPDCNREIIAQLPGTRKRTLFAETLFNNPKFDTLRCKCIATGYPNVDISILEVSGHYEAETYLEIKPYLLRPEDQASVDLIGYPGLYDEHYVQSMYPHPLELDAVNDVIQLFPKDQLVITHGPIVQCGITPTYRLSTVIGMSGSPVLLNGNVIGNDHLC